MSNQGIPQFCLAIISSLLMLVACSVPQAMCPDPDPLGYSGKEVDTPFTITKGRLIHQQSPSMQAFGTAATAPLQVLIQTIKTLNFDKTGPLGITLATQSLQSKPLKLTTTELQYLVTDLSSEQDALQQQLYRFIQSGGAVGLLGLKSEYDGDVSTPAGTFYYTGKRQAYILIAGDYPAVKKAYQLLRDHPVSKSLVREGEFTIFVTKKIKTPTTFLSETELGQYRSNLEKDKHKILFELKPGAFSPDALEQMGQAADPQAYTYMTYLRGKTTVNHGNVMCITKTTQTATHVMELSLAQQEEKLELRQMFSYALRDYAPLIRQIYSEQDTKGVKAELWNPSNNTFEPQVIDGYVETSKDFNDLWRKPSSGLDQMGRGSPMHPSEKLGAFGLKLNTQNLLTDQIYRIPIALYPSKTGQGSGEAASRFYATSTPLKKWNMTDADVSTCLAEPTKPVCAGTYRLDTFHERLLKACIPFKETAKTREKLADFYYYLKRS